MEITNQEKEFIISKIPDIDYGIIPESLKLFWIESYRKEESEKIRLLSLIKDLSMESICFVKYIPEVLVKDFNTFAVGYTLGIIDGKSVTYDMKKYYRKLLTKGFDYPLT